MKDAKILIIILAFIAGAAVSTLYWEAERKRAAELSTREKPPVWYLEARLGNVLDKLGWRSHIRAHSGRKILYGEFESHAEAERNIEPFCDVLIAKVLSVPDIPVPSSWLCRPFVKPVPIWKEK